MWVVDLDRHSVDTDVVAHCLYGLFLCTAFAGCFAEKSLIAAGGSILDGGSTYVDVVAGGLRLVAGIGVLAPMRSAADSARFATNTLWL